MKTLLVKASVGVASCLVELRLLERRGGTVHAQSGLTTKSLAGRPAACRDRLSLSYVAVQQGWDLASDAVSVRVFARRRHDAAAGSLRQSVVNTRMRRPVLGVRQAAAGQAMVSAQARPRRHRAVEAPAASRQFQTSTYGATRRCNSISAKLACWRWFDFERDRSRDRRAFAHRMQSIDRNRDTILRDRYRCCSSASVFQSVHVACPPWSLTGCRIDPRWRRDQI